MEGYASKLRMRAFPDMTSLTRRSCKFVTTVEYEASCCRSKDRGQRQRAEAGGRDRGQRQGAATYGGSGIKYGDYRLPSP
jgi:hypothetical protein